jgi:hypothetical protein
LPRIVDAENDAVTKVVVKLGSNAEWINYDPDSMNLAIIGGKMPANKSGFTRIPINL